MNPSKILAISSAPILSNTEVMPGVYLVWLESPRIASQAQPGQFVMVRCGEDTLLRRPLSIHQRDGNRIALLFSVVRKGTNWLSQRQAGAELDLLGPLGNGFSIDPVSKNVLLVAGGIGIAPLRFLADKALEQGKEVTLLIGAQTSSQLYPESLVSPGIRLARTTEDGTAGEKGVIIDYIDNSLDWADQIFACGPLPMYQAMAQMAELQSKPVQISLEVRMGCGRGICYGCTVRTKNGLKQVCADGPVFDLADVIWNEVKY